MEPILLSGLFSYPIKSCHGLTLQEALLTPRGLQYDRHWVICNSKNEILTGREYPLLLGIFAQVAGGELQISHNGIIQLSLSLSLVEQETANLTFYRNPMPGMLVSPEADQWFSDYLGFPCRLFFMPPQLHRPIPAKYGGQSGDEVAFPDQAPVLLISEASLAELNSRLDDPVGMDRFRPNLVVKGTLPFAEDQWKRIRIGDCELEVTNPCKRCIFTTIDPISKQKHPDREPLRTLTSYRKLEDGGVAFGIYLIPRTTGMLHVGAEIIPI